MSGLVPNLPSPSVTEEHGLSIFSGKESVAELLLSAAQESKLQMLPFEISFCMGSRVYFMFYYFIPVLSFLSSKDASHNAEGGSIS